MQQKRINRIKIIIIFLTLGILFGIFVFVYNSPKNYSLEYVINKVNINERYDKTKKEYSITFSYNNQKYELITYDKYSKVRKLIQKVRVIEVNDSTCILGESSIINTYPLCINAQGHISYHLVEGLNNLVDKKYFLKLELMDKVYEKIYLNYLNERAFLIWNYSGFNFISKDIHAKLNVLKYDVYDISLATRINEYIVIPDYSSNYSFNKMYVFNIVTKQVDEWNLESPVYFDSYILGTHDKSIYIMDKKQEIEFELVPHKKKMRKIEGKIFNKGIWEKRSLKTLASYNEYFQYDESITYELKNQKLYRAINDTKELISLKDIKCIVYSDKDEVYYLVKDELYFYSSSTGEVKIMSNFEWNFNYENLIFVY